MDQLLQVTAVFAIGIQFLAAQQQMPQDYCSLVVKVLDEQNFEVMAPVSVEEKGGKVTAGENEPGGARFCNLGILPVTVKVGRPESCNHTIIHNVALEWQQTRTIHVKYEIESCLRHPPPLPEPLCQLSIRVFDQRAVSQRATVEVLSRAGEAYRTDNSGRVRILMQSGSILKTAVRSDGYLARQIEAACTLDTPRIERVVVLASKEP